MWNTECVCLPLDRECDIQNIQKESGTVPILLFTSISLFARL